MSRAFVIDRRDNVATALGSCESGERITLLGESPAGSLTAGEEIRAEHKMAVIDIAEGEPVLKFGMRIGHAVGPIRAGEWVHLHNCASDYDERSNTLDGDSGAPTDMPYV